MHFYSSNIASKAVLWVEQKLQQDFHVWNVYHAVIIMKRHYFYDFRVVVFFNNKKHPCSFIAAETHVTGCLIHTSCFGHKLYCYSACE